MQTRDKAWKTLSRWSSEQPTLRDAKLTKSPCPPPPARQPSSPAPAGSPRAPALLEVSPLSLASTTAVEAPSAPRRAEDNASSAPIARPVLVCSHASVTPGVPSGSAAPPRPRAGWRQRACALRRPWAGRTRADRRQLLPHPVDGLYEFLGNPGKHFAEL